MGCGTVAALSACSGLPPATLTLQGGTPGSASDARITVSPAPVGSGAAPDVPLVVRVTDGRLTKVLVAGPAGTVLGDLSADGTSWSSSDQALDYGATYSVQVQAVDLQGLPTDNTGGRACQGGDADLCQVFMTPILDLANSMALTTASGACYEYGLT